MVRAVRDMEEHLKATQDELRRSQDGEAALRERDAVLTERVKALENLQVNDSDLAFCMYK